MISPYKNKGDRSDCNNHRDIFLLSIAGKVFALVMLVRLQTLVELVYPESQCRFCAHRFTVDMISSLCQLQENAMSSRGSSTLPSSTSLKPSTWSAGRDFLKFYPRSAVHPSFKTSSSGQLYLPPLRFSDRRSAHTYTGSLDNIYSHFPFHRITVTKK